MVVTAVCCSWHKCTCTCIFKDASDGYVLRHFTQSWRFSLNTVDVTSKQHRPSTIRPARSNRTRLTAATPQIQIRARPRTNMIQKILQIAHHRQQKTNHQLLLLKLLIYVRARIMGRSTAEVVPKCLLSSLIALQNIVPTDTYTKFYLRSGGFIANTCPSNLDIGRPHRLQ